MPFFDLYNLQNSPLGDFVIPWAFVFAMIYGVLQMSGIFNGKKAIEIMLSVTIALFAVGAQSTRQLLWNVMPWAAGVLILLALIKAGYSIVKDMGKEQKDWDKYINLGTFGLLFIFLGTVQHLVSSPYFDVENVLWALGFGAVAVLMYKVITGLESAEKNKKP